MDEGFFGVEIVYCASCNYLPLALRIAERLLSSFQGRLTGVTLVPGDDGVFDVLADGELLFSAQQAERLPRIEEVQQAVGLKIRAAREAASGTR